MRRLLSLATCIVLACSADPRPIPPGTSTRDSGRGPIEDGSAGPNGDASPTDDASPNDDAAMAANDDASVGPSDDAAAGANDDASSPPNDDAGPTDDASLGANDAAMGAPDASPPVADSGVAGPDLTVRITTPPPATVSAGGNLQLALEVLNAGAILTPPTEVLIDLRPVGAPIAQATRLAQVGVRSLQAGTAETLTLTLVLPASLTAGGYVLRVMVDPGALVAEGDESNNAAEASTNVAAGVEAQPAMLGLGPVPVGCAVTGGVITVNNTGRAAATFDSATLIGTTELSIAGLMLPQTVNPGASLGLTVQYTPVDVGVDVARLELGYDQGGRATLVVPITAEGRAAATRTDVFQQAATTPRLDLLMMVDDSGSMSEEQARLANQFPSFLTWAQNNGVDFRIAVVTSDMDDPARSGRFFGSPLVLDSSTPNLSMAFAANTQPGVMGSGTEQGLRAVVASLTPPLSNAPNTGFLRADATLGVLFLSDEDDFSMGTDPMMVATQLRALKPNGQIRVNAIVGPAQTGCATAAGPGTRYLALMTTFGGVTDSICAASWTSSLTSWGMISGPQRRFVLSRPARAMTITVRVAGALVAPGGNTWSFDAGTNSVVFSAAGTPANGATIEIAYTEGC